MNALVAAQPGFDPYADTQGVETAFLGGIGKAIGKAVKKVGKTAASVAKKVAPIAKVAIPVAQQALKNAGPIGMVASGALGAMNAGLQGKNVVDIGIAAATGAAPSGIDRAIQAGVDLARGKNVLSVAVDQAMQQFAPGSGERLGFSTATELLKKGATKATLGAARRALVTEGQKRAFDAGVGVVANAAQKSLKLATPGSGRTAPLRVAPRGVLPPPKRRAPLSQIRPDVSLVVRALRNPTLAQQSPATIARATAQPVSVVQRALRIAPPAMRWRGVNPAAVSFLRRFVPHAPIPALLDTRGLTTDGQTYVVESGDFPGKIATKLTGNGSKWPELIRANPQKKTKTTKIGKEFVTLVAGEKLIVPPSWRKAATPSAPPLVPLPPGTPAPAPAQVDATAATLQAKTILVAWSKTDGLSEPGLTDYGARAEDLSTTFGPRDKFAAAAFASWSNRTRGTKLATDGALTPTLADALRVWAEQRAALPIPATPVTPTPEPSAPSVPAPSLPLPTLPPTLPLPTLPPVATAPEPAAPAEPSSPLPSLPIPVPATPGASPAPASGATKQASIVPLVAGAILGGMAGGPFGAVIGGGIGAAIA